MARADIPEGWTRTTVGEIAEFRRGFSWKKEAETRDPGPGCVPVLRIPNVQDRLRLDDLLYVRIGADRDLRKFKVGKGWSLLVGSNGNPKRIGNCILIERDSTFLFASFLVAAGPKSEERVCGEYLFRLLDSAPVQSSISENVQGSTGLKNIRLESLRDLEVLLPPLPEQRKIAAILSTVDDVIDAVRKELVQMETVRLTLRDEVITTGLHGKRISFEDFKIADVVRQFMDFRGRTPKKLGMEWGGTIPAISANNVEMGRLNLKKETYFGSDALYAKWMTGGDPQKGDILMTMEAPLGKVALVPDDRKYILSQRVILMKTRPRIADSEYFAALLSSSGFQATLRKNSTGTTATGIRRKRLEELEIQLPPFPEQEKASKLFRALDQALIEKRAVASQLETVRDGVRGALISGQTRATPHKVNA